MSLTSKPIWYEGMFVRPQHFQQYDRWVERFVEDRVAGLRPYGWGVRELEFDEQLLAVGQVALNRCRAVAPDGTTLAIPEQTEAPPARPATRDEAGKLVKLAIPVRSRDGAEIDWNGANSRRFSAGKRSVRDASDTERPAIDLQVGVLSARLLFEGESEDDLVCLPIARIGEVEAAGAAKLSGAFIPPALDAGAAPGLVDIMHEVQALLRTRGEALAGRIDPSRAASYGSGLVDFLTLSVVNGAEALFQHLASTPGLHPEIVYRQMIALAGQLATFDASRRPPPLPTYRHDDLEGTFTAVRDALRALLAVVVDQSATRIPLEARDYGIWIGTIEDRSIFSDRRFVLAALSSVPSETLRTQLPQQIKIGPVEQIRDLVNLQLPGVGLRSLPVAPREVPYMQDAVYFELDQSSELWDRLTSSAAFTFHISGDYPNLSLEFWAIRTRQS